MTPLYFVVSEPDRALIILQNPCEMSAPGFAKSIYFSKIMPYLLIIGNNLGTMKLSRQKGGQLLYSKLTRLSENNA
jgi:hypothetical protein